jgi:1-acyl-sn-glycerol-3-phosphate acyltransferase
MPKASPIQNNFNAGEVTPLLAGRTDIAKYRNALKVSLNGIPLVQGGWTRRPGMIFIGESKNHSEKAYLYPFEFSVEQAYMLVFGPSGIRVIRNNGLITFTPQAITAISATNPAVVTYVGADSYANGDRVAIASVSGMTQVNNREFTVANRDT